MLHPSASTCSPQPRLRYITGSSSSGRQKIFIIESSTGQCWSRVCLKFSRQQMVAGTPSSSGPWRQCSDSEPNPYLVELIDPPGGLPGKTLNWPVGQHLLLGGERLKRSLPSKHSRDTFVFCRQCNSNLKVLLESLNCCPPHPTPPSF